MELEPKKLKVAELKAELSARGLPVDGLKAVLCRRLEEALLAQTESQETRQAEEVAEPAAKQAEATAEAEALVTESEVAPVQPQPTAQPESPLAEKTTAAADVSEEDSSAAAAPAPVPPSPATQAPAAKPPPSAPRAAAVFKRKADEAPQATPPPAKVPPARRNAVASASPKPGGKAAAMAEEEKVQVPASSKPTSCALHISNFLRPFTQNQVLALLREHGTVLAEHGFWMNSIKTHCYVRFGSTDEAQACRDAVWGRVWPPQHGKKLAAEFVDDQEAARIIQNGGPPAAAPTAAAAAAVSPVADAVAAAAAAAAKKKKDNPSARRREAEAVKTLDDLFRKTKEEAMIDGHMSEGAIRERVVDKLQAGFANIEQMGMGGDEQFQREWEQHKADDAPRVSASAQLAVLEGGSVVLWDGMVERFFRENHPSDPHFHANRRALTQAWEAKCAGR